MKNYNFLISDKFYGKSKKVENDAKTKVLNQFVKLIGRIQVIFEWGLFFKQEAKHLGMPLERLFFTQRAQRYSRALVEI